MVERKDGIKYNKLGHDGTGFTLNGERLNYVKKFDYVTDAEDPKGFSKVKLEMYVDDSELWGQEQEYNPSLFFVVNNDGEVQKPDKDGKLKVQFKVDDEAPIKLRTEDEILKDIEKLDEESDFLSQEYYSLRIKALVKELYEEHLEDEYL